jgi:hypothetical protein
VAHLAADNLGKTPITIIHIKCEDLTQDEIASKRSFTDRHDVEQATLQGDLGVLHPAGFHPGGRDHLHRTLTGLVRAVGKPLGVLSFQWVQLDQHGVIPFL